MYNTKVLVIITILYITAPEVTYSGRFIPFDHLHLIPSPPHTPAPGKHPCGLFSYEPFFFKIPHINEIIQYVSLSDLFQ